MPPLAYTGKASTTTTFISLLDNTTFLSLSTRVFKFEINITFIGKASRHRHHHKRYLTVQFVRFFWKRESNQKAKILRKVDYPLQLDVYDLCSDEVKKKSEALRQFLRDEEGKKLGLKVSEKNSVPKENIVKMTDAELKARTLVQLVPLSTLPKSNRFHGIQELLFTKAKPELKSSAVADNFYDTEIHVMCKDFVYQGLLTDLECDHLISLAKSERKRSAVADNLSGDAQLSDVRTSTGTGMFISKNKDPIVSGIEDKISAWTFLPKENGEDIQGGHRFATVLMYLTNVTKGSETVFPNAEEPPRCKSSEKSSDLSECAKKGIAVKPRRGDALLFFSLDTHATPDTNSLHCGCPVIEGEKWSATKWIHVDSFDKKVGDGGGCSDQHDSCERWATLGECTNNSVYMVGSSDLPGYCRKSFNAC
ncbi:Oxoglutarate/iron-dependent oxygenase [Trifolium repens]|nr:Oxoglutarate/iron-dependent oxygenase [Trifolium repens]